MKKDILNILLGLRKSKLSIKTKSMISEFNKEKHNVQLF